MPGEESSNVAYRLLEPENISDKRIIVVGGGDSAVESAMLLMSHNKVVLSYRNDKFARIKPKNGSVAINEALGKGRVTSDLPVGPGIHRTGSVLLKVGDETRQLPNDLVFIFAGGELPTGFLQKAGVEITKRFGHIVKKHK